MGASARAPSAAALAAGGDMFLAHALAARPLLAVLLLLLFLGATRAVAGTVAGTADLATALAALAAAFMATAALVGAMCAPLHVLPEQALAALAPAMAGAAVAQLHAHGGAALSAEQRAGAVAALAAQWRAAPFARKATARQAVAAWARPEQWAALCRGGPVLLLAGWLDVMAPPDAVAALQHAMSDAKPTCKPQQKMIGDAGHMLMTEQPGSVSSCLEDFLRSTVLHCREREIEEAKESVNLDDASKKTK